MKKTNGFKLPSMFRALRHRNYRLFFVGQGTSLIGTWLQTTAMSWLVYRLTGSAFLLGVVGFCSQLPLLLLSPFAGVLSDRWKRRTILRVTQSMALLQASIIAALVLTKVVQPWHIIILSLFLGVVNSFDIPARQSFMMEMVEDKNDLSNAISLNCPCKFSQAHRPGHSGNTNSFSRRRRLFYPERPEFHSGDIGSQHDESKRKAGASEK